MTRPHLHAAACGARHGLLLPPVDIPVTASDVPDVHHSSVAREDDPSASAGGGVARSRYEARAAALGEALERYAAARATLPIELASRLPSSAHRCGWADWTLHSDGQRAAGDFPLGDSYTSNPWMTEAYDLIDNQPVWVPTALVGLSTEFGALASSSGLAADPSVLKALLRATQEIVERDAFMATWLHGLTGRRIAAPGFDSELASLQGQVALYDITPAYSPHPVACALGRVPQRGLMRASLGIACRHSWEAAAEKAFLEFLQGVLFAGYQMNRYPELEGLDVSHVTSFDAHAVYYTANPSQWERLPIHSSRFHDPPPPCSAAGPGQALIDLASALRGHGIRLFYRELTTTDVAQLGIRVVRVLSPQLTPIHHDHNWPFLGGSTGSIGLRYPTFNRHDQHSYPSPFPHPLG